MGDIMFDRALAMFPSKKLGRPRADRFHSASSLRWTAARGLGLALLLVAVTQPTVADGGPSGSSPADAQRWEALDVRLRALEASQGGIDAKLATVVAKEACCAMVDLRVKDAVERMDPNRWKSDLALWIALGAAGVAAGVAWGYRGRFERDAAKERAAADIAKASAEGTKAEAKAKADEAKAREELILKSLRYGQYEPGSLEGLPDQVAALRRRLTHVSETLDSIRDRLDANPPGATP